MKFFKQMQLSYFANYMYVNLPWKNGSTPTAVIMEQSILQPILYYFLN